MGSASNNTEGRGDLTMASISLQDLRRRLYVEAKADKTKRFWGLYVRVAKLDTLRPHTTALSERTERPASTA